MLGVDFIHINLFIIIKHSVLFYSLFRNLSLILPEVEQILDMKMQQTTRVGLAQTNGSGNNFLTGPCY